MDLLAAGGGGRPPSTEAHVLIVIGSVVLAIGVLWAIWIWLLNRRAYAHPVRASIEWLVRGLIVAGFTLLITGIAGLSREPYVDVPLLR